MALLFMNRLGGTLIYIVTFLIAVYGISEILLIIEAIQTLSMLFELDMLMWSVTWFV